MTCWTDLLGVPFDVSFVDAGGIRTRTLRAGEGPAVLFLHGTSGHLEAFTRNVRAYVEAGLSVHAIDLLGHGFTGKPDYNYEIPRYVDHTMAYLDAEGISRASIVGESIGGWIAAWAASEHPDRVEKLVLVAPGGTKANPAVMERIKTSTEEAVESPDPAMTRKRLELLMYDPSDATDELVQVRFEIYRQPDFRSHLRQLLCLQDMETRQRNLLTRERLARIGAPTLIVWGHENPFGDVPEAKELHEAISGSHLVLFDHCGHWPQHEHPERFNRLSLDFILRNVVSEDEERRR